MAPHHSGAGHLLQDPIQQFEWSLGQRGTEGGLLGHVDLEVSEMIEGGLLGLGDLEVSQKELAKGRRGFALPLRHLVSQLVPVHSKPLGWSHVEVAEEVLCGDEKSKEVRIGEVVSDELRLMSHIHDLTGQIGGEKSPAIDHVCNVGQVPV